MFGARKVWQASNHVSHTYTYTRTHTHAFMHTLINAFALWIFFGQTIHKQYTAVDKKRRLLSANTDFFYLFIYFVLTLNFLPQLNIFRQIYFKGGIKPVIKFSKIFVFGVKTKDCFLILKTEFCSHSNNLIPVQNRQCAKLFYLFFNLIQ